MNAAAVTIYRNASGFRVVAGAHKVPEGIWTAEEFPALPAAIAHYEMVMRVRSGQQVYDILRTLERMKQSHDAREFALAKSPPGPRPPKPKKRARVAAAMAFIAAAVTGCASMVPTALVTECEHVSHPAAGPPFGPKAEEDSLNQCSALAEWGGEGAYLQAGFGYVLADGGFYGPRETFTARAGYRFPIKGRRHE